VASADVPVVLIKGTDPQLVGQAAREAIDHAVAGDPFLSVEEFSFGVSADMQPVLDALLTPPFLGDRRVVVIREIELIGGAASSAADDEDDQDDDADDAPVAMSDGSGLDRMLSYLASPSTFAHLILVHGGKRLSIKLTNAVKKIGTIVDTEPPKTAKGLSGWVEQHVLQSAIKIDRAAVAMITANLGEDVGQLDNLLDRLVATYGSGSRIGVDEVALHLGAEGTVPSWDLTDAIDQGDADTAVHVLRRLTAAGGRHPLAVLAVVQSHFERIARLDGTGARTEDQAAEILGIKAFPASKALRACNALGSDKILRAIELLHQADIDLKGAAEVPEDVTMDVLISRLAKLAPAKRPTSSSRGRSYA
jgi:DNA polymerase-3 subunit delta